jgi:KUP system potassium uptake protein
MLAWFVSIAALGVRGIISHLDILTASNPWHAVQFFVAHPADVVHLARRGVFVVVTGGEASTRTWVTSAQADPPRLVLASFCRRSCSTISGRARSCCARRRAVSNPFYLLRRAGSFIRCSFIATRGGVLASQALISGAFSLTQQAIQLGYSPRMRIIHTSKHERDRSIFPRSTRTRGGYAAARAGIRICRPR